MHAVLEPDFIIIIIKILAVHLKNSFYWGIDFQINFLYLERQHS